MSYIVRKQRKNQRRNLNPGCLPAALSDKSERLRTAYPAFWSTTGDTVRFDTQMYLQLKLWAFRFCQATAANVHIHHTISLFLKGFISIPALEPGLSRQKCSKPLWDTEAIQKEKFSVS